MNEKQVCPWCQMEIVWDPVIGPEEECPHCLNELKDYRTLTLDVDEAAPEDDLYDYEQKIQDYLDKQEVEQTLECEQCQQKMIEAGVMKLDSSQFKSKFMDGLPPFIQAPIELVAHVCPACFQVKSTLSEASRLEVIQRLQS